MDLRRSVGGRGPDLGSRGSRDAPGAGEKAEEEWREDSVRLRPPVETAFVDVAGEGARKLVTREAPVGGVPLVAKRQVYRWKRASKDETEV